MYLLAAANNRFDNFVNGINARAHLVEQIRVAVDKRAIAARNLVLLTKSEDLRFEQNEVIKAHATVSDSIARLKGAVQSPDVPDEARKMVAAIDDIEKRYAPVALGIVELALKGEHDRAIQRMNDDCRPLLVKLTEAADVYANAAAKRANELVEAAHAAYLYQRNLLILGVVLAVALSIGAGALILRSLKGDLGAEPKYLRDIFSGFAAGDLTQQLNLREGDSRSVLVAVKQMQGSLIEIVDGVRQDAEVLSDAAAQIAAGNRELAAKTESQASSLAQTNSSMEQFGATILQNANNATQANRLAQTATDVAERGGQVVARVVETMQGINESSRRISDIIGVIDSIAFQTNLLALNAAVEAARAGEQGRGFAVVAGEVRSLAGRTSEAAREIKSLITESVDRVEQGTLQVEDAGDAMQDIVSGIRQVTDIVKEIAAASQNQSTAVAQVSTSINSMDQVVRQNLQMVETMATGASDVNQMAQNLVNSVASFKLPTNFVAHEEAIFRPSKTPRPQIYEEVPALPR
jgi:methyl-accepting chemotaxis protein